MATYAGNNTLPFYLSNASFFSASSDFGPYTIVGGDADEYYLRSESFFDPAAGRLYTGFLIRYVGNGFTYDQNTLPTGGNYSYVQIIDPSDGNRVLATLSNVSLPLAAVFTQTVGSVFAGNDTFNGGPNAGELLLGGDGDDLMFSGGAALYTSIYGTTQTNDQLFGGAGNDTLSGGSGTEILDGGTGADLMGGGSGDDTYYVDNTGDNVVEYDNQGNDTVIASINYVLPGNVERLVASGNFGVPGLELRGNALNNEIIGNVRDDTLRGEAGNDVLRGGDGHDRLYGGLGADVLDGGNGIDQARYDEADYAGFTVSLENPAINTGPAAGDTFSFVETLILSSGNDLAYGNGVQNTLEGRAGNDFLFGRANIDALYGDSGNDHLFGGTEADLHDGGDGFDYARYDDAAYANFVVSLAMPSINTGVAAGDTFVSIEGLMLGTGDDVGHGNSGANFIYGRDGNDTLYGKEGNDTLFGEAGADRFIFDTATRDLDVIGDFLSGTDGIGLSSQFYGSANMGGGSVRFAQGAAPASATAQATIYYDTTNHLLSYSDSSGSFRIVELTGVASVTQSDLFFV